MKQVLFWIPAFCAVALSLSSCGNGGGGGSSDPGATAGPFDPVTGQYREDWADDPTKWRKPGSSQRPAKTEPMQIAKNDEVPLNSIPLAPSNGKPGTSLPSTSKPVDVTPLPPVKKSEPVVVHDTHKKTVKAATSDEDEPKAKKKPVLVKAKPKPQPKPKTVRWTVKRGDSLSSIAKKTGSSVAAIKAENGISGTLIRDGQSLVIPRH